MFSDPAAPSVGAAGAQQSGNVFETVRYGALERRGAGVVSDTGVGSPGQEQFDDVAEILSSELGADCLLGCTGESIVAGAREIENSPALALWVAHLPGVTLRPMHLEFNPTADGGSFTGWHDALDGDWPADASLLLLGEEL